MATSPSRPSTTNVRTFIPSGWYLCENVFDAVHRHRFLVRRLAWNMGRELERPMTRILDADAAVRAIPDGACVGVGGSINTGHPMALVRALIRARVSDLTVVGLTSGLELDLLVAAGCAARLSSAYVGAEEIVGLPPGIRWAAEEGRLEVWETEEGIHLASLRARAHKLPYTTWTGALGTSCTAHPLVEEAVDEATGAHYLKVRPLTVDAALVWAEAADEDGNLLLWGPDMGDDWLRNAADLR